MTGFLYLTELTLLHHQERYLQVFKYIPICFLKNKSAIVFFFSMYVEWKVETLLMCKGLTSLQHYLFPTKKYASLLYISTKCYFLPATFFTSEESLVIYLLPIFYCRTLCLDSEDGVVKKTDMIHLCIGKSVSTQIF
jgi:hypothetical protein